MTKGVRMPTSSKMYSRAAKRLSRVFVDLLVRGKKRVTSMGCNKYPLIERDVLSRYDWTYFVSHKSDVVDAFEKFVVNQRVESIRSEAVVVRSNNVRKFKQESLENPCRQRNTKQSITIADRPKQNGVAKWRLVMIESTPLAATTQASKLFPGSSC